MEVHMDNPNKLQKYNSRKKYISTKVLITQPFFELLTSDFAWKFIWTVEPNDKVQNKKVQKYKNAKKCKKCKNVKIVKSTKSTKVKKYKTNKYKNTKTQKMQKMQKNAKM